MPRDLLLSKKFFSYLDTDAELNAAFQEEKDEIVNLIKTKLYPAENEKVIYYSGKHNNKASLDSFIHTEDYKLLQAQLQQVIEQLKTWGEKFELNENTSLDDFLIKLKNPTEKISVLYADGKRSLETIVVLLDDQQIELDLRKVIYHQLLADNELSKCIDGCYTRISSIAQQLQGSRENANQINRWIRSYANEVAKEIAAKRPFAMPESYQVLVCRTLNIGVETNELHASNFLLSEARENGFPIDVPYDGGALEIANKIKAYSKYKIVELYLDELNEKVRASQLVDYVATRLHYNFKKIMSDSGKGYLEKIAALEYRLNLVGLDQGFLLEEILDDETFELKASDYFKIHSKILYSRNNKNKTTVDIDQYLTNQTLLNIAPLVNITLEISERTNSSYFIDSRKIQVDPEENKKVNDTTPFKRVDLDHQLHNNRSNTNSNVTRIRIKRYVPTEQKEDDTNRALNFLDHYDRRHDKRSHSKKSSKKINTLRTKHTLSKTQNTKKEGLVQRPTNKSYHVHQPQIIAKSNNTHYLPIKNTKKLFHAEAKLSKHLYSQKEFIFPAQAKTDQFFSEKNLQKFPPPRIDRDFKKPTNSENLHINSASKSLTRVVEPINVHANLLLIKWSFYHFVRQEKNNHRVASHKKIQAYKNTLNYMERKNLQDFYNPTPKFNSSLKI